MARAEVGDDVNGDDPTVTYLEEKMAGLLGMEAGLFVPSGTMSNAVAIRTHTQPGDEIIAEEHSHLYVCMKEEAMLLCRGARLLWYLETMGW